MPRRRWWIPFIVLAALLSVGVIGASYVGVPYVAYAPGDARPTSSRVDIKGARTYPVDGQVLFVTVGTPRLSALGWLVGKLDPKKVDIYTEKQVFGDQSEQENRKENLQLMTYSKDFATYVALTRLGYDVAVSDGGVVVDSLCLAQDQSGTCTQQSPVAAVLHPQDVITAVDSTLALRRQWRIVLVGDHRQLQAVGRGGLFHELCATGRSHELQRIHRFDAEGGKEPPHFNYAMATLWHAWTLRGPRSDRPATPSSATSNASPTSGSTPLPATAEPRSRPRPTITSTPSTPLSKLLASAPARFELGPTASASAEVSAPTSATSSPRAATIDSSPPATATLCATANSGSSPRSAPTARSRPAATPDSGIVVLPAEYVAEHVRLGYAATEHGNQSVTVTVGVQLVTAATTRRGLYVGATRGHVSNHLFVVTDERDLDEARDVLDAFSPPTKSISLRPPSAETSPPMTVYHRHGDSSIEVA